MRRSKVIIGLKEAVRHARRSRPNPWPPPPVAWSIEYWDQREAEMKALEKHRARIVRYRLMGYSAHRIAQMFDLRLPDVRALLREKRLVG
jgi:hypothetical protein